MCRLLFTLSFAGCTHILVLPFGGWQWHPAGEGYAKESGAARAMGRGHPAAWGLTYAPPYMAHTQAWGSEWPRGTRPTRLRSAQGTKHRLQGHSQPSTQTGQKEPFRKASENTDPIEEHKPSKGAGSKEDNRTINTVMGRGRKGTFGVQSTYSRAAGCFPGCQGQLVD